MLLCHCVCVCCSVLCAELQLILWQLRIRTVVIIVINQSINQLIVDFTVQQRGKNKMCKRQSVKEPVLRIVNKQVL